MNFVSVVREHYLDWYEDCCQQWRSLQRGVNAQPVTDRHGQPLWLVVEPMQHQRRYARFTIQAHRRKRSSRCGSSAMREDAQGDLYICDTKVFHAYHGRGIGSLLARAMIQWAQEHCYPRIWGLVVKNDRIATPYLVSFWERHGFVTHAPGDDPEGDLLIERRFPR